MSEDTEKIFKSLKDSGLYDTFKKVEERFEDDEVFLVGGALRNALMGRKINDLDFSTVLRPEEVLKRLSGESVRTLGIEFGTVTWNVDGVDVEITTFRCDETYENHRHPKNLRFGTSKLEDLERRDFTMNAIIFSSSLGLYDPFNGAKDIKAKVIKAVGVPDKRFKEDALRILRMYRFYLNYSFKIDEETLVASDNNLNLIEKISKERVVLEVKKVFSKDVDLSLLLKTLNNLFGVSVEPIHGLSVKSLNLFEQVYYLKKVGKELDKYIYEKAYKRIYDLYTHLENSKSVKEYKILILKFYNKNKLSFDEADQLWFNAREFGKSLSKGIFFKPLDINEQIVSGLKKQYSGKELGDKLLEEELKTYFSK